MNSFNDSLRRVLLIPPDFTRYHSNAGEITQILYQQLKNESEVKILPALGTHTPLTNQEIEIMFGKIPKNKFITHDWRNDVIEVGTVPSELIKDLSEDKLNYSIKVEINKHLKDNYDLIISIGQVVPHEVSGMANGNKNILVGVGGSDMINKSHFLGACYGMERLIGRIDTPVRSLFNYAESDCLEDLPLIYVLTVLGKKQNGKISLRGIYGGNKQQPYKKAAILSQKVNLTVFDNPFDKIIVYLEPNEYKSTWLGNKAIYRTRMVIKDGGDLIIVAPGLRRFGEDNIIDNLIRKYGYRSSREIIHAVSENKDLQENLSAAAHLIHGSSEGRFNITYCSDSITKDEIEGVNYQFMNPKDISLYDPKKLIEGYNHLPNGEDIFFIINPAIGLWTVSTKFNNSM
ncbi:MAG: lactate racemase domain-containing protein [Candidatus Hodarchaeota archaeon]